MEGKNVLVLNMVVLALLLPLLAVSAHGDPLGAGVSVGGAGKQQLRDTELECCDDCRCDWRMGYCTCTDWTQGGYCINGCYNCQCDNTNYPYFCRCNDLLDSCPRTCMIMHQKDKATL